MDSMIREMEDRIAGAAGEQKVDLLNQLSKAVVIDSPKRALEVGQQALALSKELGYDFGIAQSLLMLAYANRSLSDYTGSMPQLAESLKRFRNLGHLEGQMRALNLLGINYFYFGRYEQALEHFEESLELAVSLQHGALQASVLNNIGEIHREMEKHDDALTCYFKALEISEIIDNKQNISAIHMNIGHIHNSLNKNQEAMAHYQKSLDISSLIGDRICEGEALNKLGEVYEKLDRPHQALVCYMDALSILQACENRFFQIDVLINLGNYHMGIKKQQEGKTYLDKALQLAQEMSADKMLCRVHIALSQYYEALGDFEGALIHYKAYYAVERQVTTEKLEEKLKLITMDFKMDQLRKEAEIYRLTNIELKRLSSIDELTEIPNRRVFNDVMEREWSRCQCEGKPLAVLLADIDYFKRYNDGYGHLEGDNCLRRIAGILSDMLHPGDFIARYGGEEFVMILPDADFEHAKVRAEGIRKHLEQQQISHAYSPASPFVTISLGVAVQKPSRKDNMLDLIEAADKQLYTAKENGRNQVRAMRL